jgi:hypothetical protein
MMKTTTLTCLAALFLVPSCRGFRQPASLSSEKVAVLGTRASWGNKNHIQKYCDRTSTYRNLRAASSDALVTPGGKDDLVFQASNVLFRISWLSWWSQVILTVVSSITLIFARNILLASARNQGGDGLLLAGTGLAVSFISILWTWGGARLAQRLVKKETTRISAANMIRRCLSVGITINLAGMALALVGAEQIVGALAVKVLTQQGVFGSVERGSVAVQTLQPLDILVVQGNTNALLSHFCSLVALLYLTKLVRRLDPPSVQGDERKRK